MAEKIENQKICLVDCLKTNPRCAKVDEKMGGVDYHHVEVKAERSIIYSEGLNHERWWPVEGGHIPCIEVM